MDQNSSIRASFNTPFSSTNYVVITQSGNVASINEYLNGSTVYNLTTTTFDIRIEEREGIRFWLAIGY